MPWIKSFRAATPSPLYLLFSCPPFSNSSEDLQFLNKNGRASRKAPDPVLNTRPRCSAFAVASSRIPLGNRVLPQRKRARRQFGKKIDDVVAPFVDRPPARFLRHQNDRQAGEDCLENSPRRRRLEVVTNDLLPDLDDCESDAPLLHHRALKLHRCLLVERSNVPRKTSLALSSSEEATLQKNRHDRERSRGSLAPPRLTRKRLAFGLRGGEAEVLVSGARHDATARRPV
jgi:hypothetical protein